ncbi:hypothetical protein N825_34790 [Skermanella stibiiresistens SB22]|uniref:OmpA-like domain-containing protein n=1 Tax=Skermanella stibiiresistens SB22 TaxID=1385369 RepID=W9H7J7_9PROT|nr:hypothetical protein [Skermanella stibiiresistens]EWY40647.1 hypothetical protein N825_34790 [Skermanella stibiiresistens SB22]
MLNPVDSFSKDEGYYASMADLMAGMLFIFIIVAMVFALDVRKDRVDAVTEAKAKVEAEIEATVEARVKARVDAAILAADSLVPVERPVPVDMDIEARAKLVENIRDHLLAHGVAVESAPREGLLRIPADPLFGPDEVTPSPTGQGAIARLAEALDIWLPCVAGGAPPPDSNLCGPFARARLRSLRIETHIDTGALSAADADSLTGARAVHLLSGLLTAKPGLMSMRNDLAERLLDVRGMGAAWPLVIAGVQPSAAGPAKAVKGETAKTGQEQGEAQRIAIRARHRRIDLRFDMRVPGTERPGQAEGVILRPTVK